MPTALCQRAIILALSLFAFIFPVRAAEPETPAQVAQVFYAGYLKTEDTEKYVAKSKLVHPRFKKAFSYFMNHEPSFDPVIDGQDTPEGGFRVGREEYGGDTAYVILHSRDKANPHQLKVHFILEGDSWLISQVNNFPKKGPRPE